MSPSRILPASLVPDLFAHRGHRARSDHPCLLYPHPKRGPRGNILAGIWILLLLSLAGCAALGTRKAFDVTLQVDFGPAGRPPIEKVVQAEPGATPEGVLAKACAIQRGAVCCNPRETAGIDGVAADPATNRWWTVSLNGSKKVSPYKTKLKPGDIVRWEYREYGQ